MIDLAVHTLGSIRSNLTTFGAETEQLAAYEAESRSIGHGVAALALNITVLFEEVVIVNRKAKETWCDGARRCHNVERRVSVGDTRDSMGPLARISTEKNIIERCVAVVDVEVAAKRLDMILDR